MNFEAKLETRRRATNSALCIGLDPELERMPAGVSRDPAGVLQFTRAIVEATSDLAATYKPNFAFYEALGPAGMEVLQQLIASIPRDIPVLGDAKRSDIGNTARLYARAALDVYGCDAIVVNPYQGRDSVEAYLAHVGRGVYVLARTSNPGAADFQDIVVDGEPLYLRVVREAQRWRCAATLGFVVGATAPEQLRRVRQAAPQAQLLIPGIGAQGGDLAAAVRDGSRADGGGLLVSASRSILYASSGADFAAAARQEAERLVQAMRRVALEAA
ncbi:MAG TPA: orotidine-5'-phosphate decarboxylase [Chloroflexota bacterium]|jgi:orotidine-5'-phosphate decarboxylase|nr:orotidine-5'-phosphate decarboxylase [Chloroflexota bacterium]